MSESPSPLTLWFSSNAPTPFAWSSSEARGQKTQGCSPLRSLSGTQSKVQITTDLLSSLFCVLSLFLGRLEICIADLGFPGGSNGRESACNPGDPVWSLDQEDTPGEGMWFSHHCLLSLLNLFILFILSLLSNSRNIYFCFIDYAKAFDCVDHNKHWKILKEMGIPNHLICLMKNLYAGQETTVRTEHGTTGWFQIGKGVV